MSEKIIDYCIMINSESHKLSKEVNFMIQKGWQPLGRVGASGANDKFQAMVKYEC